MILSCILPAPLLWPCRVPVYRCCETQFAALWVGKNQKEVMFKKLEEAVRKMSPGSFLTGQGPDFPDLSPKDKAI